MGCGGVFLERGGGSDENSSQVTDQYKQYKYKFTFYNDFRQYLTIVKIVFNPAVKIGGASLERESHNSHLHVVIRVIRCNIIYYVVF